MKEANSQATHANSEDGCQDSEKQGTQTHAGTECAGNVEGQKADEEKSIEAENESHGSKVVDDNTLASEEGEEDEEDDEEDDEEASGDSTEDSGEDGSMWEEEESASEVDDEDEWSGEDDEEEEGETTEEEDVSSEGSSLDQGVPLSTKALRHEIPFENLDKIFSSFGDSIQRSKVRLLLFKLGHCFNAAVCEDMLESIEDADMRRHFHEAVCEDMQHIQHQSLNILQCRELYRTCFLSLAESGKKLVPVFVFVNPDSGGHLASRWLELPPKTYMHGLPLNGSVEAWTPSMRKVSEADISEVNAQIMIYSLMEGDAGKKRGFQHLAKVASESSSHVRVIVCGGDGSVSWVITEMTKHKIDFDHVALGVCAYGTGNDFSRVLGWGPASSMQYPAEDIDKVRALATDWIQAQLTPMDVWSACVSTKPGGNFALAKPNGSFGLTEKDKERLDIRSIKGENKGVKTCHKVFVNYFSLGALSQVGSSFEQRRTKSRLKNMYTYAKLGLSKAASSKDTLEIDRLTAHLREENEYILSEAADHPPSGRIVSLIFSNIPSMMGGSDLWARSSSTVGKGGARFLDWVQDLGDQCIELMTFSSFKDVVYEKMGPVFHGNAKRLHGGRGPFHLQFKDDSNPDYERTLRKTGGLLHFQADGEYMAVYSPDSVKVQWYRKISVMRALRGQHIDFLSEVLDDGARLLHFIQFLDRRGNTHAAESAYVAAMVRSSAASKGVVEVLHHIVEELLSNESLIDYLEDLSCRRKTSQDDTHRAEDEPNFVVRHEILGAHVDKEHEMFTFGTCITHGVRLAVETQSLILEVLGCDSGDPLSSVLRDTRLTSIECVQRWCGPDVDAEHLQVHSARSFDVPRLGHIWVEACEVPFFFDDAAPETFQRLRAMAGIREQDYINSVCRESSGMITFGTNSRSGESFFFSHDGLYMIKTISDSQASKLLEMLPSYEAHLKVQTRSLLVRFVGLYRVRTARAGPAIACAGRWFVVMASIFYTSLGIHEKYDLKGSTSSNRRSKAGDIERGLPLKDLDWKDRLSRDGPLQLSAADAERLLAQHECDTAFLESFDLFDYSVLLGIHDISKASGGQSGVGATRKTGGHLPFSAGLAAAKFLKKRANRKAVSEDAQSLVNSSASAPISTVLGKQQDESGECDSGSNEDADSVEDFFEEVENLSPITRGTRLGEAIVSEDGGQLYFIGIIDILEPFDKHRAAEEYMLRGLAQVSGWAAGHSLVNPAKYRKRQMEFFRKTCPATGKQKEGKMSRIRSSVRSGFGLRRSSTSIRLPI